MADAGAIPRGRSTVQLWSATACRRFVTAVLSTINAVTKRRQAVALQSRRENLNCKGEIMTSTIKRCALLLLSVFALMSVVTGPASAYMKEDPTQKELTAARSATAKYHDVSQAEADGYINIGFYLPGEGYHFVNFGLIDGNFEHEHPEVLLYIPDEDGDLRLVGVEYLVPLSANPPEGFYGDQDVWRSDTEGFGLWELNAWI